MKKVPRVSGAPDRIWLNYGELDEDVEHEQCAEVTWCAEKMGDSDVEYRRVTRKPRKRPAVNSNLGQ